jgi:hypothetical protein
VIGRGGEGGGGRGGKKKWGGVGRRETEDTDGSRCGLVVTRDNEVEGEHVVTEALLAQLGRMGCLVPGLRV